MKRIQIFVNIPKQKHELRICYTENGNSCEEVFTNNGEKIYSVLDKPIKNIIISII